MVQTAISATIGFMLFGCSGRKVEMDTADTGPGNSAVSAKDQKIENLTAALSRAQSRIEELDAKVSALSDKLEATRISVDNISGNKPLNTEPVGTARDDKAIAEKPVGVKNTRDTDDNEERTIGKNEGATGEFARAMGLFRSGKYSDAELAFNHFTERYPEHVLAGSAQFYSGESYFQMSEYKLALGEYGKVIQSFGTSPRVATAMVRMSQCYENAGNYGEAKRTLALAHDIFEGNPSLDLALVGMKKGKAEEAPSASSPHDNKDELSAAPMEPARKKESVKADELDDETQK